MGKKPTLLSLENVDVNHIVADLNKIRESNTQRFEMEMLTAVFLADPEQSLCAGYLDVTPDAFWVRGHMPGYPLMPGVLICEAAAQLGSFFASQLGYRKIGIMGLGGLDGVRFRGTVRPGDRLILIDKVDKVRHNTMNIHFEAVVNGEVVADGDIRGILIPTEKPAQD